VTALSVMTFAMKKTLVYYMTEGIKHTKQWVWLCNVTMHMIVANTFEEKQIIRVDFIMFRVF